MFRRSDPAVQLKTPAEIARMREAGKVVARTLDLLRSAVRPGVSTLDLDAIAEESIRGAGAVPSFKGYHGFTGSICASVNEEVVHGIPRADKVLAEGDLISIDCGAILDGWHGDSAITVAVGEARPEDARLLEACEESMWAGIAELRPGNRLGDVGAAIDGCLRSRGRFGNVQEYGGHGIGTEMHMDPHVLNYGRRGKGIELVEGMCLAIEPMANAGTRHVLQLEDGWTVVTRDGARSAHFEHSVAITAQGPLVLTAREENRARIAELGWPDPGF
ncbi:type I methionyl aminopeptidase [Streptomonospora nanhaiensis]|uniref:Methionine aminopeptidase n=1 Tax=Streptomonospora nanhaiensis TaxID=1323731 RepID=A0A853BNU4_9ACTN|nr:type I methionyl aminopeptidase [Streptomonospora nanhaiensis]MBV2361875.1 type I methionyl aminopeptidase [Streptomonospora nanhaiensis]MBX9389522.1 type I methionyl aminopeptidase [Streptomonospora nanhaiensis]NYI96307.1 methionyl aminopeptidase [Streptomonospora nanhaiensis]